MEVCSTGSYANMEEKEQGYLTWDGEDQLAFKRGGLLAQSLSLQEQ